MIENADRSGAGGVMLTASRAYIFLQTAGTIMSVYETTTSTAVPFVRGVNGHDIRERSYRIFEYRYVVWHGTRD
jgi:hypothetical protein